MSRKTISVDRVKELANQMLANSHDSCGASPEYRESITALISSILHETGNYKGFRYLSDSETPAGESFGIDDDLKIYDRTRRAYF